MRPALKAHLLPFCLALVALLAACAVEGGEFSGSPPATFVPYRTATATPSPQPLAAGTVLPPTPQATPTPFMHVVQKNDTLLGIALRYGVELADLLAANPGVNPRVLSIGQQIRIPGPAAESAAGFLPTPTPVPVDLSDTQCYWDLDRLVCLATARNPGQRALESVSAMVAVADAAGEPLAAGAAFAPLNLLPPGASIPLEVSFSGLPRTQVRASAWPLTAFLAAGVEARYLEVEVVLTSQQALAGQNAWLVKGELRLQQELPQESAQLAALLVGLDSQGGVVGYRKQVWLVEGGAQGPWPFSLTLVSLGPPIAELQAYGEGVLLP